MSLPIPLSDRAFADVASGDSGGAVISLSALQQPGGEGKKNPDTEEQSARKSPAADKEDPNQPRIRTLPQAIHEYWRKVHSRPCAKPQDGENGGEKDGSSANGGNGKNGEKNGNGKNGENGKNGGKAQGDNGEQDNGKKEGKTNGDDDDKKDNSPKQEWLSAHSQATLVTDYHGSFRSPYQSNLSLSPNSEARTSETATLFLDARLWEIGSYTGEIVFNPEVAGGIGFSGTNGVAGFPNGEITRVGVPEPTPYFARLFLRQTWGFGGEQEDVDDGFNQIAGKRDINRFTLSAGKFAFTDFIDNNAYSHDPRTQFLNWSMMYNGAWDYPANVRGYDYGVAMEYNEKFWAVRYGIMAEPSVANGAPIDARFTEAFGQALEWEGRWTIDKHPGRVRLMTYLNRAHMGSYGEALLESPVDPQVASTRAYRYKYGYGLNFEQEVTKNLGVWGRAGWSDGHTETWAFTPIDRTAAIGLLLKGTCWARPDDSIGLAAVWNGLAKVHRDYLRAGGQDFSIGDGALNYGLEKTIEFFYRASINKSIYVTFDYQFIDNPAYNRDRGPVSAETLVVHIEY